MNRVHIKTYGCQMNERDSEAVAAMLRARGYRMVDSEDDCDVLLLNTCSVRDAAEQKAIGKAGHLLSRKRSNPDFVLGILGCMAQNRGAGLLDRLPDVDLIIGTQKFHRVPDYLDNLRAAREAGAPMGQAIVDIEAEAGSQNTIRDHVERAERQVCAFVSIQQGCNMDCSFCIVPTTRGDERSRPMDEIVRECQDLAARVCGRSRSSGRSSRATEGATIPTREASLPSSSCWRGSTRSAGSRENAGLPPRIPPAGRGPHPDAFLKAAEAGRVRPPAGPVGQQPHPEGDEPPLPA